MASPNLRNRLAETLLTKEHLPVLEDVIKEHIEQAAGNDDRLQQLFDLRGAVKKFKSDTEEAGART